MLTFSRTLAASAILCASAVYAQQSVEPNAPPESTDAEVRFTDDSVVRMTILQEHLEVLTKYGKLTIPTKEIQSIDFGVHLPDGLQLRIAQAIDQLGHDVYKTREIALRNLIAWGPYAYPQVHAATKSNDLEVVRRAVVALDKIRAKHPARNLRLRDEDVISTSSFTVVGKIATQAVRARSENFGELDLQLCKLRSVRWLNPAYETELTIEAAKYGSGPNQWLDTGFEVRSVSGLLIVANGTVDLWPQPGGGANYQTTARGFKGGGGTGQHLPGTLIGKIGEDGPMIVIGDRYEGAPPRDGRLYLQIVPSPWGNSSTGSYQVRITPKNDF